MDPSVGQNKEPALESSRVIISDLHPLYKVDPLFVFLFKTVLLYENVIFNCGTVSG
jgi:hypothetical protein